MKNLYTFSLILFCFHLSAQAPITQVEGYLEVYHPEDTSSTYVGLNAGQLSMPFIPHSGSNAFFGKDAGSSNTIGGNNTFLGPSAGVSNISGSSNTFIGRGAGQVNTTGNLNIFVGSLAGLQNTTGSSNIFLGSLAGMENKTGEGNIVLGNNAGPTSSNADKNLRLYIDVDLGTNPGNDNPLIYGEFDNDYIKINGKGDYSSYLRVGVDDEEYPSSGEGLELVYDKDNSLGLIQAFNRDSSSWSKLFLGRGNVGIGVIDPQHPLHVNGNVEATSFNGTSDRHQKELFVDINPTDILEKITQMQIQEWQYKESNERHIGPVAQDFYAAFGLGLGETTIATVDADGVALAAIKALAEKNKQLDERVALLEKLLLQSLEK